MKTKKREKKRDSWERGGGREEMNFLEIVSTNHIDSDKSQRTLKFILEYLLLCVYYYYSREHSHIKFIFWLYELKDNMAIGSCWLGLKFLFLELEVILIFLCIKRKQISNMFIYSFKNFFPTLYFLSALSFSFCSDIFSVFFVLWFRGHGDAPPPSCPSPLPLLTVV